MAKIILLSGYARSGKDTIANYLVSTYMYQKIKFAKPLYDALCIMFRQRYQNQGITLTPDYIDRHKNDIILYTDVTWREALQTLGTEWGRVCIGETIWINIARDNLIANAKEGFPSVIADCRFLNEANFLMSDSMLMNEVSLWYIFSNKSEPQLHHDSEKDIEKIAGMTNKHLANTGTKEFLYKQVEEYMNRV